eukprot:COSAG06_NODE_3849_length_4833_cov_3.198352_4_plen_33_part_00
MTAQNGPLHVHNGRMGARLDRKIEVCVQLGVY